MEKLAADPAPAHPAALIRHVGTHNTKNGSNGLCHQIWNGGAPQDITDLEALDELLAQPLLTYKAKPRTGNDSGDAEGEPKPPVDVDVRGWRPCAGTARATAPSTSRNATSWHHSSPKAPR